MHPSKKVTWKDSALEGKRIVIGITGSIAAVETVKLIREILRHGADVIPVMTPEACKLIHPYAIEFAAGVPPITEITGQVEHVLYCGNAESAVDILLIAPATANTISKIANGIDDTTVTTFATTALGTGIPVLICPSMHGTMYGHRIVSDNIGTLKQMGVGFVEPAISEGKAKMPSQGKIVEHIVRTISRHDQDPLAGKRVLIIGGSTAQPIDAMRILTNKSSGKSAVTLATEAFRRGAEVELWYGWSPEPIPDWLHNVSRFMSIQDLVDTVSSSSLDHDVIIMCAAISDYTPVENIEGKLPSGKEEMTIAFKPTRKVIELVREQAEEPFLVGYKAESGISESALIEKAGERMRAIECDLMVANLLEEVEADRSRVFIIDTTGGVGELSGSRASIASSLFEIIGLKLKHSEENRGE